MTIELTLPTMTCGHCVRTVTTTVQQVDAEQHHVLLSIGLDPGLTITKEGDEGIAADAGLAH